MPFTYVIDHDRRLILATAEGILTSEEIIGYQQYIQEHPELASYHSLLDMSQMEQIALSSSVQVQDLAQRGASLDVHGPVARLAIVAPSDGAFGMARMFMTWRSLDDRNTKELGVFRSLSDALAFLGLDRL